tara:strand:- start:321 stop:452 length:132 start_codon:yes stop_codon:yes gene_type:complete
MQWIGIMTNHLAMLMVARLIFTVKLTSKYVQTIFSGLMNEKLA